MCDYECCIPAKSIHSSSPPWREWYKEKSNIKAKIPKTEGLVKNKMFVYETYKNTVMSHGRHIYEKASYMKNSTIHSYPQSDYALPHWKCVLQCCTKFPYAIITDQETDYKYSNTSPSIQFHVYNLILECTTHGRILLNDKNFFRMCKHDYDSEQSTKLYTLEKS